MFVDCAISNGFEKVVSIQITVNEVKYKNFLTFQCKIILMEFSERKLGPVVIPFVRVVNSHLALIIEHDILSFSL